MFYFYIQNDGPSTMSHMQVGLNRAGCNKRIEYLVLMKVLPFVWRKRPTCMLVQRWHGGCLKLVLICFKLRTGPAYLPAELNP